MNLNIKVDDQLEEELCRLDSIIGEKYANPFYSPICEEERCRVKLILQDEISYALRTAVDMDKAYEEISLILKESPLWERVGRVISIDRARIDAEVRRDWASALRNAKRGENLSGKIGYAFSGTDIIELAALHKANKFRKKIEDLLEDCNFHTECALMSRKDYSRWL